jgi:drug/metabolite transporter (DMT)-like permease
MPSTAAVAAVPTAARGIALYTWAILVMSAMDTVIKWLSADYPTIQIVFFRSLFGLVPLVVLVVRAGGPATFRTSRPGIHLLRGLISLGAAFFFFYAFRTLPLADAYAIAFAAPLLVTALSVPMLGEHVGPRRWAAVVVGFIGVAVMLRPGSAGVAGFLSLGALAALAGTFLYALNVTLIRRYSRTETNAALILYSTMVMVAGSLPFLPSAFVMPDATGWLLLITTGLLGGIGLLAITEAFRIAPVAIVAPFEYTAMLWAVLFGWIFWGDLPDAWIIAGSAIVIGSGLYILHRETRPQPAAEAS